MPLKIAIIGAGIAGLSAYLFLHKHLVKPYPDQFSIIIYEKYDVHHKNHDAPESQQLAGGEVTAKVIGNAIGIGKNGLNVLRRIDDGEILSTVMDTGNSITKWTIGTARGWKIVDANVQGSDDEAGTVMIARQVFWEILRDQVLAIDTNAIEKRMINHIYENENSAVLLHSNSGVIRVDLAIGADGLRSMVRKHLSSELLAERSNYHAQSWLDWLLRRKPVLRNYYKPNYEGLTGLGGFVPGSVLEGTEDRKDAMAITFGPNGFFGYGYIGNVTHLSEVSASRNLPPLAAWWSTFSSEDPRPYQSEAKDVGPSTTFDRERALKGLLDRHKTWADPSIQAILAYIKEHVAIEHIYPTYTTPELPKWTFKANSIILIGDAAHALQPSSGQGACQALEDAEALALFLKHHLTTAGVDDPERQKQAIRAALEDTVKLRLPRVAKVYQVSQRMSRSKMDMGIIAEYSMYFFIWLGTKVGFMRKYNEELFEYDLPSEVEKILAET